MTTWGHALWWRAVLWQIRWQGAAKQYLQAGEVVPPWKSLSHIKSWMVWRGNFMKTWFEGGKMIREWFEGATSWEYRMAGQDYSRTVWRGNIMKIWIEGAIIPEWFEGAKLSRKTPVGNHFGSPPPTSRAVICFLLPDKTFFKTFTQPKKKD